MKNCLDEETELGYGLLIWITSGSDGFGSISCSGGSAMKIGGVVGGTLKDLMEGRVDKEVEDKESDFESEFSKFDTFAI